MFGNISQILEMKKKAEALKEKLGTIIVTEEHKGVTIDCNGNRQIINIHVSNELLNNKETLEKTLCEAINKCLSSAEQQSLKEMSELTGGLGGLGNLFK